MDYFIRSKYMQPHAKRITEVTSSPCQSNCSSWNAGFCDGEVMRVSEGIDSAQVLRIRAAAES
jgi:hypothetical protein